jgi:hypothetical protein
LKLKCDEPLSIFAFNINLRRYNLEEERGERRRAEEAYAKAREERDGLELLVERRSEEIATLEDRLEEATTAAEATRTACEERDALLREGAAMLDNKEIELDDAASYAVNLQQQLDTLAAERTAMAAAEAAGTPQRPGTRERSLAREEEILALKVGRCRLTL